MKPEMKISNITGTRNWYLNGMFHREDGPAREFANGSNEWFIHGRLHRVDGPAINWVVSGDKEWWLDGIEMTEQEWLNKVLFNEVKISPI